MNRRSFLLAAGGPVAAVAYARAQEPPETMPTADGLDYTTTTTSEATPEHVVSIKVGCNVSPTTSASLETDVRVKGALSLGEAVLAAVTLLRHGEIEATGVRKA